MVKPVRNNISMKTLFNISILSIFACTNPAKEADNLSSIDSSGYDVVNKQISRPAYHTTKDTLLITTQSGDTLTYSRKEFNEMVDDHPELYRNDVQAPDPTYYFAANKNGFGSEAGQDSYYILYAYFLQQKNGIDKYAERRKNLLTVFSNINALYQRVQHGGTYFGHQASRILAYAEFSVYLYRKYEDHLSKTYDISKQKALYIQSLRQLVADEVQNDEEIPAPEKTGSRKELNAIIDSIDKAITDNFSLRRAQEFQHNHYQYY
jgi:hypothetical protein